jgi:hypothetical protein
MKEKVSPAVAGVVVLVVIALAALALMKMTGGNSNKTEADLGSMPGSAKEIFSKGLGGAGKSAPSNANQGIPNGGIPSGMMGVNKH